MARILAGLFPARNFPAAGAERAHRPGFWPLIDSPGPPMRRTGPGGRA